MNLLNLMLFITILTIPFYQIRIPIFFTSLSLLSLVEIFLIIIGSFIYKKYVKQTYFANKYFLNLSLLLLTFLFLTVLRINTLPSYGIFIEWFLLPMLVSFIILIYLQKNPSRTLFLQKILILIFSLIIFISLFYLFTDQLTFDRRLKALYLSPNHLAMILTSLIFIVLSLFYANQNKKSIVFISQNQSINANKQLTKQNKISDLQKHFKFCKINFSKIALSVIFLTGLFIIFKTNSINNIIIVSAGMIVYLAHFHRRWIVLIISSLFIILIIFLSLQHKITNLENFKNLSTKTSITSRLVIYDVSLNLIRPNLLTGAGLSNFQDRYLAQQIFYPPYPEWAVPTPHNFILMNLFSAGFIFNTIFLLIFTRWIFEIFTIFNKAEKKEKQLLFFYFMTILAILCQGILDTSYWKNDLALIFWIVIVLGLTTKK